MRSCPDLASAVSPGRRPASASEPYPLHVEAERIRPIPLPAPMLPTRSLSCVDVLRRLPLFTAAGGGPDERLTNEPVHRHSPTRRQCLPGEGDLFRVKADGASRPRLAHVVLCLWSCGFMSSRVGQCWRRAGETLRICSDQTAGPERHLVDLAQPDHALAGGQPIVGPDVITPGLPSGQRVIAPRGGR